MAGAGQTGAVRATDPCPCGRDDAFGSCCLPLHVGERQAGTAEDLMRARYSAYATGDLDFVWRTWHPRTRPGELTADDQPHWTRLQILATGAGQPGDARGEVEFIAHHRAGVLHERSRFARRAGRWCYVDGDLLD